MFLAAFAGCVGEQAGPDEAPAGPAGAPSFSEDTGALRGIVVGDDQVPIGQADVLLQEVQMISKTDEGGVFTFNDVAPGEYTLEVQALGYSPKTEKVSVVLGEVAEATITLLPIGVEEPFHTTLTQDGQLACSFRAYPGVPLGEPVIANGWYTGVAVCGLPGVNTTTGDKFLLRWETGAAVQEVMLEMEWTSNQALGKGLTVNLEDPEGINNGRPIYGNDTGTSPLSIYADGVRTLNVTTAAERDCVVDPCSFTTRVFAEANTTDMRMPVAPPDVPPFGKPRDKIDAGVVWSQRFTQYLTTFHNGERPDGFTALADS